MPASPALYGSAEWAAGYSSEENPFDDLSRSEQWSILHKAFLFGTILTAVGIWVKVSKRRGSRDDVGHEKTMA